MNSKAVSIGSKGLKLPVLGQGCGGGHIRSEEELKERAQAIRYGIECGLTFIDTAEAYHQGRSETAVGLAVRGQRDKVVIASKVSPENLTRDKLIGAAEASLKRLGTDYIDLYQIHWSNPSVAVEEWLGALDHLVASGKVREVGVCNFSRKELHQVLEKPCLSPITTLQSEYNLFDRSMEAALWPHWLTPGRAFIAYSPLEQGSMAGGAEQTHRLQAIADRHQATAAQVALAWIVSHPGVVAIPRSTNWKHILENSGALALDLGDDDLAEISESFSPRPLEVVPSRIRVVTDGLDNRAVYQTKEEAIRNHLRMTPSPQELAQEVSDGEFLKPVRVRPTRDTSGRYDFDLIEGRLRYWAWVLAHGESRPVHVLIRAA